jgi:hypothetical protein
MEDITRHRAEKDLAELKRLIQDHFEQVENFLENFSRSLIMIHCQSRDRRFKNQNWLVSYRISHSHFC